MPNMSYCRFRNTLNDLRDCQEALHDPVSRNESAARASMVSVMAAMLAKLGVNIDPDEVKDAVQYVKDIREDAA